MNSKPDLYQRFKDIMNTPLSSMSADDPEIISHLYQTDWVRILVIRNADNLDWTTIEIESSLPQMIQGEHKDIKKATQVQTLIEGMIKTLEYLLRLQESGFSLDIIGQDCMWTAYKEFDTVPDEKLFEIILP